MMDDRVQSSTLLSGRVHDYGPPSQWHSHNPVISMTVNVCICRALNGGLRVAVVDFVRGQQTHVNVESLSAKASQIIANEIEASLCRVPGG